MPQLQTWFMPSALKRGTERGSWRRARPRRGTAPPGAGPDRSWTTNRYTAPDPPGPARSVPAAARRTPAGCRSARSAGALPRTAGERSRGGPLRRTLLSPFPRKALRQRLRVRRQMPITPQALNRPAPAALASTINSITFHRYTALVSLPRPPNRRPESFLQHIAARKPSATTMLLPLQVLFPYGVDPVLLP